MNQTFDI